MWHEGPTFLKIPREKWPIQKYEVDTKSVDVEARKTKFSLVSTQTSSFEDIVSTSALINDFLKLKQVRTNIGLADTLIPSSFIYLIYMGGIGTSDSIKIIFGYHVNS